jgi:hypothetical protein
VVEHRQDLGRHVVDGDLDEWDEGWEEAFEIVVAEVEELGGELDAGGWSG